MQSKSLLAHISIQQLMLSFQSVTYFRHPPRHHATLVSYKAHTVQQRNNSTPSKYTNSTQKRRQLTTDLHVFEQLYQGTETVEKTLPQLWRPLITRLRLADQCIPVQQTYSQRILDSHRKLSTTHRLLNILLLLLLLVFQFAFNLPTYLELLYPKRRPIQTAGVADALHVTSPTLSKGRVTSLNYTEPYTLYITCIKRFTENNQSILHLSHLLPSSYFSPTFCSGSTNLLFKHLLM